jgi:hypothetical protein
LASRKSDCRDGRVDNAQALRVCGPLDRVGSNPTPGAFSAYLLTIFDKHFASRVQYFCVSSH